MIDDEVLEDELGSFLAVARQITGASDAVLVRWSDAEIVIVGGSLARKLEFHVGAVGRLLRYHETAEDHAILLGARGQPNLESLNRALQSLEQVVSIPIRGGSGTILGCLILAANRTASADLTTAAAELGELTRLVATSLERATRLRETLRRAARQRALIRQSAELLAIVTSGGTIDYVSPSVTDLLQRTQDELVGTSAFALLHPDEAGDVIARFTSLLRNECTGTVELRLTRADGEWRTLEVSGARLDDGAGADVVVVNARDITDQRSAMTMRQRMADFLGATPDFIALLDPNGRVLALNRVFRELLGISDSPAETARLTLGDLFPSAIIDRLRNEGIPAAVREGSWSGEIYLQGVDGHEIPASQVLLAHRSASGKLEFLSTLARDITERKQAETALRQSEAHFRSLIENALDAITIVDAEGSIQFVSPSAERLLGYSPAALLGANIFDYVHPDDREEATSSFANVLQEGWEPQEPVELRIRHKDGLWRTLESVSHNLLSDPAVGGIVINSRDVSERRRAEEALIESQQQLLQAQKMEAVGRLAGGIAHDFNNLLTAIGGFAELLMAKADEDDPKRSLAAEIQGAATRATALTRQLLAFSRRQVLQPEVLDLNARITEIEMMLQRLIGEDIRIVCELATELGRLKADPGQLEQVVMNLVVNARDAMPEGGEIHIRTANVTFASDDPHRPRELQAGEYILLEVADTGIGMPPEVQDRIFEPFFTTKDKGKGTGLGLSTVYGIVTQSEGSIGVHSRPGRGTTFRIYLPRVDAELPPQPSKDTPAWMPLGSAQVLVVEDEVAVRILVRSILEQAGYEVFEAAGGPEALALVDALGVIPELLLTDVVMPEVSGPELARELSSGNAGLRVLYMSGYADEEIVHHGVLDPAVELLQKPFSPGQLLRRVHRILNPASE